MTRKLPKILALMLALIMSVTMVTACNKTADTGTTTTPTEEAYTPFVPPTVESTTGDADPEPVVDEAPKADVPLVVADDYFSKRFTPFFAETVPDVNVYTMTQITLMTLDRAGEIVYNGINGEKRTYNGEEYEYKYTADLSQDYDEATDITTYRAKIRDDMVFSDGHPVDIDDLIFTYYVYLDPSYTGSDTLYSYDIVGLDAYRNQLSDQFGEVVNTMIAAGPDHQWSEADGWPEDLQQKFWADVTSAWNTVVQSIIDACNGDYIGYFEEGDLGEFTLDNLKSDEGLKVAWGMLFWGFGEASVNDDGNTIFTAAVTGREWNMTAGERPTLADYYAETYEAYGGDLDAFASVEEPNGNGNQIAPIAAKYFKEMSRATGGELTVKGIEGIKRINDYEIEIQVHGFSAPAIYSILGQIIAPLHYYGDPALYNPANGTYGFDFGDLTKVHEKDTQPMGAGPYNFVEYNNGVVYFEANPLYWEGEPKTKYIQFKESPPGEEATGITAKTHDQSNLDYSPDNRDYLKATNSNGEISGDIITTTMVNYRGYGYIGMSSYNVSVDGERGSEASKNLRKALATVMAVHRETACNSYYQDSASVINYPISNTNWAAPQPMDEGYEVAFSKDVNGNPIYTADMTPEQKYDAALQAALGFFEAAGYTVADGKVVSGPSDVRKTKAGDRSYLEFDAWVGASGTNDHPVFAVYTDFKEDMAKIGIKIEIIDVKFSDMTDGTEEELCDIWAMAWQATVDPDMYQIYHGDNTIGKEGSTGSNIYGIEDAQLDQLIMDARKSDDQAYRKAIYKQCFDVVMDWAVEIPNYQRNNFECFSTERINTDTITPTVTTNWGWRSEIHLIEMR